MSENRPTPNELLIEHKYLIIMMGLLQSIVVVVWLTLDYQHKWSARVVGYSFTAVIGLVIGYRTPAIDSGFGVASRIAAIWFVIWSAVEYIAALPVVAGRFSISSEAKDPSDTNFFRFTEVFLMNAIVVAGAFLVSSQKWRKIKNPMDVIHVVGVLLAIVVFVYTIASPPMQTPPSDLEVVE